MMTFDSTRRRLGVLLALAAIAALSFAAGLAEAQEPEPALQLKHHTYISVQSEVLSVPKLEAKAIAILRTKGTVTGEQMTLDEARAKVRVDTEGRPDPKGRTDVARCLEIVFADDLQSTANVRVSASALATQHPSAPLDPVAVSAEQEARQ